MCSVRFMVMYVDESVDVYYADGRRVQLSPCGSEFMIEKHLSPSSHPLQPRERVRQRTRFAISEYKALVVNALAFRNKYATHPYLPEELITVEFIKKFNSAITEVEWPGSDSCTTGSHGEITVCSVDGHAELVLSSSGEEFTVEFICQSSQNEVESQYLQLQGHQHKSTCLLGSLSLKSATVKGLNSSAGAGSVGKATNNERLESTRLKSEKVHVYTRVIQQYSRVLYQQTWCYPLSLAVKHWESQKTQINNINGQDGKGLTDSEDRQTPQTGLKTHLPKPLPLKCPSPHQHRWRYDTVNPDLLEQEEEVTAELVKVVWCKGIIYRIVDGVMPMVEISPGDGSVIRSNGVLANYFTHYKAGAAHRDAVECVYYLCGLPPDVPGQLYSVQSIVTRASRILKCFIQARSSLSVPLSLYCWNEAAVCDCERVVQEVTVAGTGHFKALSDGTVEVLFLDGVRAQMMWRSDTCTPAQCGEMEQRLETETKKSHRWCQLNMPDGHQTFVQVETDKTYHRYVSVVVQWCDWVKQTEQDMSAVGVALSDSAHSDTPQPITCRSVVSELEKIKRFNFLLENSPVLRSTARSLRCERSPDLSEVELTENCISEALLKTSRAIQDIDTLLSDRP
ncbi:uncharacterized protein C5orf34 homolog isoform X2 [Siphateles boraxobius]|uniref:uncharacterized protein C5orf34 homolog isoform X2 n=1 Tax=Siphateles boraxobius TaxID=180520 RepID=UPI0040635B34